jgi:hypothetical protein
VGRSCMLPPSCCYLTCVQARARTRSAAFQTRRVSALFLRRTAQLHAPPLCCVLKLTCMQAHALGQHAPALWPLREMALSSLRRAAQLHAPPLVFCLKLNVHTGTRTGTARASSVAFEGGGAFVFTARSSAACSPLVFLRNFNMPAGACTCCYWRLSQPIVFRRLFRRLLGYVSLHVCGSIEPCVRGPLLSRSCRFNADSLLQLLQIFFEAEIASLHVAVGSLCHVRSQVLSFSFFMNLRR